MKLTNFHIKNFRRHENLFVNLGDITILLGLNNIGKSSIMDALGLLAMSSRHVPYRLSTHVKLTFEALSRTGPDGTIGLSLMFEHEQATGQYELEFKSHRAGSQEFMDVTTERVVVNEQVLIERMWGQNPTGALANNLLPFLGNSTVFGGLYQGRGVVRPDAALGAIDAHVRALGQYRIVPHFVAEPGDASPAAGSVPSVNRMGQGMGSLLRYLSLHESQEWTLLVDRVRASIDGFEDFEFGSGPDAQTEQFLARFSHSSSPIPAPQLSDGTLSLIGLIALLSSPRQWRILCLEEPEIGLTPRSIRRLVEAMHEGAPTERQPQVLISTHSPFLVSSVLNTFGYASEAVSLLVVQEDPQLQRTVAVPLEEVAQDWGFDPAYALGPDDIARVMDHLFG